MEGKIAVVSGSDEHIARVRPALEAAGFEVSPVIGNCSPADPGSVDCYVQLPPELVIGPGALTERLADFLADGLVSRCRLAAGRPRAGRRGRGRAR